MTQDVDIILKGLYYCSRENPDCDNCPFTAKEDNCRELASNAEKLIKSLLEKISNFESKLVEINNKFSEGDFAKGIRLLIAAVKEVESTNE